MHALSALELLDLWDAAAGQPPPWLALRLLAAAYPDQSGEALAALTIGERDARLLLMRESLWGRQMSSVMICPACRERLELKLDTREMLAEARDTRASAFRCDLAGYTVLFRLPNSADLFAALRLGDPEAGHALVLRRCLIAAQIDGQEGDAQEFELDDLPSEVVAGVVRCMGEADPLADITLGVACPACAQNWAATFDIVSFLWTEIESWVRRVTADVHVLAAAYGWSEREILGLSPGRRRLYLEMAPQ